TPQLIQRPGTSAWIARARLVLPERGAPLRMTTRPFRFTSAACLGVAGRPGLQPQAVEADEAFGIVVVIGNRAFLEGHELHVVERVRRGARDDIGRALVELYLHFARYIFLALVDQRLQHFALRRIPEAIIDQ